MNEKSAQRDANTAGALAVDYEIRSRDPGHAHFVVPTQGGSVLYVSTKFEADRSLSSKVIRGSRNYELRSRDPGHAHLGVVLWSYTGRLSPVCLYQI